MTVTECATGSSERAGIPSGGHYVARFVTDGQIRRLVLTGREFGWFVCRQGA
jgi:hypothetical protein